LFGCKRKPELAKCRAGDWVIDDGDELDAMLLCSWLMLWAGWSCLGRGSSPSEKTHSDCQSQSSSWQTATVGRWPCTAEKTRHLLSSQLHHQRSPKHTGARSSQRYSELGHEQQRGAAKVHVASAGRRPHCILDISCCCPAAVLCCGLYDTAVCHGDCDRHSASFCACSCACARSSATERGRGGQE